MFDLLAVAKDATPEACRVLVEELQAKAAKSIVLLLAEGAHLDLEQVVRSVSPLGLPVTGGVFPALINGAELLEHGAMALGFSEPTRRIEIMDLTAPREKLEALVGRLFAAPRKSSDHTVLIFVDGQKSGYAGSLLEVFQLYFQVNASYVGGGAGCATLEPRPCLFTESRVLPPGSGLAMRIDRRSAIAVEHGWTKLEGPFFVSRADRSTVLELDWRPALETYSAVLRRARPDADLGPEEFVKTAALFPLGVHKLRDLMIVRDPFALTENGGISTLGRIPQHSVLSILHAEPSALLDAATQVAEQARADRPEDGSPHSAFIADCVSRRLALGERFPEELARIASVLGADCAGALTLGEIASQGDRLIDFFNKTVVVGAR